MAKNLIFFLGNCLRITNYLLILQLDVEKTKITKKKRFFCCFSKFFSTSRPLIAKMSAHFVILRQFPTKMHLHLIFFFLEFEKLKKL